MPAPATALRPVRVGCSGWNDGSWKEGGFYPPKLPAGRWLERYADAFDTVEVNSTFDRLASKDAVARGLTQTPPDYLFTLKASQYLTHFKRLTDLGDGIQRYYARIEPPVGTPRNAVALRGALERLSTPESRPAPT